MKERRGGAALARRPESRRPRWRRLLAEESQGGLELAQCVSALVVSMLEDMAREEHDLLELARLDHDGLSDQMTG